MDTASSSLVSLTMPSWEGAFSFQNFSEPYLLPSAKKKRKPFLLLFFFVERFASAAGQFVLLAGLRAQIATTTSPAGPIATGPTELKTVGEDEFKAVSKERYVPLKSKKKGDADECRLMGFFLSFFLSFTFFGSWVTVGLDVERLETFVLRALCSISLYSTFWVRGDGMRFKMEFAVPPRTTTWTTPPDLSSPTTSSQTPSPRQAAREHSHLATSLTAPTPSHNPSPLPTPGQVQPGTTMGSLA